MVKINLQLILIGSLAMVAAGRPLMSQTMAASKNRQVEGAHRAASVLGEIRARHDSGETEPKSYFLTDEDLNALVELELAKTQVQGQAQAVEKVRVEFLDQNRLTTFLTADMDKVNMSGSSFIVNLFRGLFSGEQNVEVEGELETADGMGRYSVTRARINGVFVPSTVVELMLSRLGGQLDPPFDPTQPFQLLFGIRKVEITSGQVTLHTGIVTAEDSQ